MDGQVTVVTTVVLPQERGGQPTGKFGLQVVVDVLPLVLDQTLVVDTVPPVPVLFLRQTVRGNSQPSTVLVERLDHEGPFDEDVVAAAVEVIETVGTLLVSDQHGLQKTHIVEAKPRIAELGIVATGEFHLDPVLHVRVHVAANAKPHATETKPVLW